MTWPHARVLPWLLPVVITAGIYLPGTAGTDWILDDTVALAQHAHHGDLLGEWLHDTYGHAGGPSGHIWRPLPATLQHLAALAFGREPAVFRLLNVLVHLVNLGLLYRLARGLGGSALLAGGLATAFALHPAVPEAVCWSSDIYDLVMTTFLLLAVGVVVGEARRGARWGALFLLQLGALLSKETALAFLPVVGVAALLRRGGRDGLACGGAAGLAAAVYLALHGAVTGQGYGGAGGQSPVAHQLAAWLTSAGWLVQVPPRAPLTHFFDPAAWGGPLAGGATLLGLAVLTALAWRRERRAGAMLAVGALAWALLLAPTGPAVPLVGLHPFRYAYGPLALCLPLAAAALRLLPPRPLALAGGVILGGWCLVNTPRVMDRVAAWRDPIRLFEDELAFEPGNPYAGAHLARNLVGRHRRVEEGLRLWTGALDQEAPPSAIFDRVDERWDLAQAAYLNGRPDLALEQVQRFISAQEARKRPVPGLAWCLAADALDALGRADDARAVEGRCVPATPTSPG